MTYVYVVMSSYYPHGGIIEGMYATMQEALDTVLPDLKEWQRFGADISNDEYITFDGGYSETSYTIERFEVPKLSQDALSLDAMLDKLGDVNLRHDPDGYRCWVAENGVEHFGTGTTRYESVKACYDSWYARNVELFGEMK